MDQLCSSCFALHWGTFDQRFHSPLAHCGQRSYSTACALLFFLQNKPQPLPGFQSGFHLLVHVLSLSLSPFFFPLCAWNKGPKLENGLHVKHIREKPFHLRLVTSLMEDYWISNNLECDRLTLMHSQSSLQSMNVSYVLGTELHALDDFKIEGQYFHQGIRGLLLQDSTLRTFTTFCGLGSDILLVLASSLS